MAILQTPHLLTEDLIPQLASYQMLPQIRREQLIDEAVASIPCSETEIKQTSQQFYEQNQLTDETIRQAWLTQQEMSLEFLETRLIPRLLKIEKFKQQQWSHKLESYFLERKGALDRVIYSLIQVQDAGIAEELYFRIHENEQSFAEAAREYSQGPEAYVNGMIGPVEIGTRHPALAQLLTISQPGQLWRPMPLKDWFLIIRLEKVIAARFDASMRQRLLHELFEDWIQEQLQQRYQKRLMSTCR